MPVRVHEVGRPPGAFLDYFDQVISRAETHSLEFRFVEGRMRRFDVDVLHVCAHLFDRALGAGRVSYATRREAVSLFISQLTERRIRLVQTVMQPLPPAEGEDAQRARQEIDSATSAWVVFDESTTTPDPDRTVVIPLAHYRERFLGYPRGTTVQGRLLWSVTPQLSAEAKRLLGVTKVAKTPGLALRMVGLATSDLISKAQVARQSGEAVSSRFARLSDAALVEEMGEAELVVQPRLASFEDWQTVLLALSLDRPVLVPDIEAMRRLAEEVGPGWVHHADTPFTAAALDAAVATVRENPPRRPPRLERRAPQVVGDAYAQLFRDVARVRSRKKTVAAAC